VDNGTLAEKTGDRAKKEEEEEEEKEKERTKLTHNPP